MEGEVVGKVMEATNFSNIVEYDGVELSVSVPVGGTVLEGSVILRFPPDSLVKAYIVLKKVSPEDAVLVCKKAIERAPIVYVFTPDGVPLFNFELYADYLEVKASETRGNLMKIEGHIVRL